MPVDPLKIPEAVRRIREFRNNLAKFLSTGRKSEVDRIGIELFALTLATFTGSSTTRQDFFLRNDSTFEHDQ